MAQNQTNNNRIVMILAAAVVVLFIAFVAVVLLNNNGATGSGTTASTGTGGGSTTSTATSNPGVGVSAGEFDASKATKVPAGTSPDKFVSGYYQNILDKKWEAAFKMQPAASQTGSVADFQSTQTMYGMVSFKVFSKTIGSTDATVVIEQDLGQNGTWGATWTFQKSGDTWLVVARKVSMGAPQ